MSTYISAQLHTCSLTVAWVLMEDSLDSNKSAGSGIFSPKRISKRAFWMLALSILCVTQTQRVSLTSTQLRVLNSGHKSLTSAQLTRDYIVILLVWRSAPLYLGKLHQLVYYALQESSCTYTHTQIWLYHYFPHILLYSITPARSYSYTSWERS